METKIAKLLKPFLRYGVNSALVLCIKLSMAWLLLQCFSPSLAYLLIHILIFFVSYLIHARWSFRVKTSSTGIFQYFRVVILFKCADYLCFSILLVWLKIEALWCITFATLLVACARFIAVNRVMQLSDKRNT